MGVPPRAGALRSRRRSRSPLARPKEELRSAGGAIEKIVHHFVISIYSDKRITKRNIPPNNASSMKNAL